MIKIVGLSFLLFTSSTWALVPLEGILMGEANEDLQQDPLNFVFRDSYHHTDLGQKRKVKLYHQAYTDGTHLYENCSLYLDVKYSTPWKEKQARRTVVSALQYIGLDVTVKAIGTYAKKLEVGEEDYARLSSNLLKNYCSKNLTVYSLKTLERSLKHYYDNPVESIIPTHKNSPYVPEAFRQWTEKSQARSNEFDYAIKSFRSLCSWGGEVEDYRLLAPYLSNRFIMAMVNKNLKGLKDEFLEQDQKVQLKASEDTVRMSCEDLVCRRSSAADFKSKFPLSIGSTGADTDIDKLYCGHFRYLSYSPSTIPQVKAWVKEADLEDPIFETSFFLSLLTHMPDPIMAVGKYQDLPLLAKSSVDERWTKWSREILKIFSQDLMFEESLKIKTRPLREQEVLKTQGFQLNFDVTLGELDRVLDQVDKLALRFEIKLSKNYLRSIRTKLADDTKKVDTEAQKILRRDIAQYIGLQLKEKEKLFSQKMWNQDFQRLITDELIEQISIYQGSLFESYQEKMVSIPVRFSYGVFALGYLRYRADVQHNRLKLTL